MAGCVPEVPPPFSTSIQDGYLEVGEIMQVDVVFRPDKAEPYESLCCKKSNKWEGFL